MLIVSIPLYSNGSNTRGTYRKGGHGYWFFVSANEVLTICLFHTASNTRRRRNLIVALATSSSSHTIAGSPIIITLSCRGHSSTLSFISGVSPHSYHLGINGRVFALFKPRFIHRLRRHNFSVFLSLGFRSVPGATTRTITTTTSLNI